MVARQPILDHVDRVGYELLYRSAADHYDVDDMAKTSRTVVASLLEFGLDHLVGSTKAWFNVSADFLEAGHHLALPPERVVLELLEHEVPTDDLRDRLAAARQSGYQIALDDYARDSPQRTLLDLADYVKVDLTIGGAFDVIADLVAGGNVVLAEKVETPAERDRAFDAGASLFQGYFFARPSVERRTALSPSRLSEMRNLARLADPVLPFEDAVEIVTTDLGLSTRMLVAANSSYAGLRRRVESIHEVVVFLGAERVRRTALLCILDDLRGDLPRELLRLALTRAELCRSIAGVGDAPLANAAFSCGLLSVLDALTGQTMTEELLDDLGLDGQLVDAIVHRHGQLGGALTAAIGIIDDLDETFSENFNALYQDAIQAADNVLASLDEP